MADAKYSIRLAAQDAFSSTFRDFEDVSEDVRQAVRDQQKELRDLNRAARDMDGYDRLQRKLEETSGELTTARTEQARLAREMREAENPSQRLTRAYDRATAKVKTLESAERGHRNELGRVSRSLTDAGIDTNNLAEEQRRLERSIESANGALQSQRGRLEAVRDAQGRIDANRNARADLRGRAVEAAAMAYVASRPINQAMDLETSMTNLGKVFEFQEGEQQRFSEANLRLASERMVVAGGLGATDLADIQYAAGQSGIFAGMEGDDRFQGVMDFTRQAAIMASAFDISAAEAGSSVVSWRMGMGIDGNQVTQLADAVNFVGNNLNTNAANVGSLVTRQGALAVNAGMTPEQTAALAGAFLNPGTSADVAGTGMKNFLLTLNQGSATTDKRRAQWEELGFSPEDLARRMQQDAPAVIQEVLQAIRARPEDERTAVTETLFGRESISAISPLLANLEEVDKAFGLVSDQARYTGSMLGEAETVSSTSRVTLGVLTSELGRLTTEIGEGMLPVLNAVLPPLTSVVSYVADFASENEELVGGLAAAAAGVVALKTAAIGLQFGKLLLGQGANYARLARARSSLNTRQAQTASAADAATRRLNAAMNMLGRGGAAGAAGRRGAAAAGRATRGAPRAASVPAANTRMAGMTFAPVAGAAPAAAPAAAGNAARGWRGGLSRVGDLANRAGNSRVAKWGGRAAVPLMLLGGAAQAAHAAGEGDAEGVGSAVGGMAGGLGGAWAGAGAGAALGTMIFPGVGTAVGGAAGGLIGGIAGSEAGRWVGEKAGGFWNWMTGDDEPQAALDPSAVNAAARVGMPRPAQISPEAFIAANRVASPEEAAREVTENTDNRTIAPSFDIKIESSGDPARDEALLDRLMERLRTELMPMLQGGGLDVRLDASLTDGGA
tara:strand:- start:13739 stop:16441 length:2703 start_codon:yes stop_codon:yes gene_type:complete